MLPAAAMRPWFRPVFFVFFLPLGLAILSYCLKMLKDLIWKKDLLVAVEPVMYRVAIYQIVVGIFIFSSMCALVYVLLTRRTQLLKHVLVYQQTSTFICIAIMGLILFTRHPSLKTDENFLNNAMSGYGKDDSMTKMMDTTQNETGVEFYTGGCLVLIFAFKEHIAYKLLMNAEILVFFEIFLLFLVGSIIVTESLDSNEVIHALLKHGIMADHVEDAAANAERKQEKDVPCIYTLDVSPPMPLEA